jgi:hypothetical protein
MKESCWNECIENTSARKISKDEKRAESLIDTAKERINLISEITEKNCNFVFEDYYTSILEIIQAKAFLEGYNISNHICIGFYIRDVLKRNDLFRIFDDIRYKRNSLTYYGSKMDFETAKEAIEKCKKMIRELNVNKKSVT